MRVAVIPARGGSKRIPRKNIKNFCGQPMIGWPIAAAQNSALFDRIIVSTDDAGISTLATAMGAEVPFIRPPELADDLAGTTGVIAHATRWCLDQGWHVNAVCCICATAALLDIEDLKAGLNALETGDWLYAFSATDYPSTIFRSFRKTADGSAEMFFPDKFVSRSQDLPVAFHDPGLFYWGRPDAWLQHKCIFDKHSFIVPIQRWRVQDIDEPEDWLRAEIIFRLLTRERATAEMGA